VKDELGRKQCLFHGTFLVLPRGKPMKIFITIFSSWLGFETYLVNVSFLTRLVCLKNTKT